MMKVEDLLEVKLKDSDSFLKIKETLTRIGVAIKPRKELFQSCHILHKKGKYYIVHFKQMFELDGKVSDFDEEDLARLNRIANLLEEWNLLDIVDKEKAKSPQASMEQVKVIRHSEKDQWSLIPKYNIGVKKYNAKI